MTYTATIKNLTTNVIEHTTGESKQNLDSILRWASAQGIAGYDVMSIIGATGYALVNCHTGERAVLIIDRSDIV